MVKTKQSRRGFSGGSGTSKSGPKSQGSGLTGFSQHVSSGGSGSVEHLPPDVVLALQRTAGNAAVSRLVAGPPAVQRDDEVGNPVIGLKRGDGLNFGTSDLKPRVSILQGELNEKMTAGLNPDGMFGPRTGRALQDFEEGIGEERQEVVNKVTGDALMDRKEKPPVPPKPDDNELDPALEARLDQIQLEYLRQLRAQNQGLVNLERDLRDEEKPAQTLGDKVLTGLLETAAEFVVDGLLGGFASPGLIFQGIMEKFKQFSGAKDDSVTVEIAAGAINFPLEKMHDAIIKTIKEEISPENAPRGSMELFVDAQRNGLFNATERTMEQFSFVKQKMRTLTPGPKDPPTEDLKTYRFNRAVDLHLAVREGAADAGNQQYFKSLQHYSAYRAQGDLKQPESQEENLLDRAGTDMSKLADKDTSTMIRGILEVHIPDIDPDNLGKPIQIVELHVSGLGKRAREHVNQFKEKSIGDLGFPRRVWDGHDDGLFPPRLDDIQIMVGRSERGGPAKLLQTDSFGRRWVAARGGGNFEAGLEALMNEVDQKKISDAESGKGLQGPA